MTLDPEIGVFLLSLFIGFGVGLVSGTMGVGGGIIMVPAAVLILGYGQHIGQGISLVVMIPTTLAGAITHYRMKNLELRPVLLIAIGAVAAGLLAALLRNSSRKQRCSASSVSGCSIPLSAPGASTTG